MTSVRLAGDGPVPLTLLVTVQVTASLLLPMEGVKLHVLLVELTQAPLQVKVTPGLDWETLQVKVKGLGDEG